MCLWHSSISPFLLGCQDDPWTLALASYHSLYSEENDWDRSIFHDVITNSNSEIDIISLPSNPWTAGEVLAQRMWSLCVCTCVCVCVCVGGGGSWNCKQYSSSYYMHMAGVGWLVVHFFYLEIHNSSLLLHVRLQANLPGTSNWCPAGMIHEATWLEQPRQSPGWSHPRRFREERWGCVLLGPPCLIISSIY